MPNNIRTVGDFLLQLLNKGVDDIKPYLNIGHNPTIGDMYEGLTKCIIDKAIFSGMNLRVVSGKIKNDAGEYSNQIDCMVVIGDGEIIPFTNKYTYHISQVIMVVEVKKNLHTSELASGYNNLLSVVNLYEFDKEKVNYRALKDSYAGVCQKAFPVDNNFELLDVEERLMCRFLAEENELPIRVVFGYSGFANELSLRNKFFEFLNESISKENQYGESDCGIVALPNLIVSGNNTIIKTNGMPYSLRVDDGDDIVWMASYRRCPIVILLELLWTRLTYQYGLSASIFGDELFEEALAPFLTIKYLEDKGWECVCFSSPQEQLDDIDKKYDREWSPVILTLNEFVVMSKLCSGDSEITINSLQKDIGPSEANDCIDHLVKMRLICVDDRRLLLLTNTCVCAIDPKLGFVAGDDYDGRFSNWLFRRMSDDNLR